jgi:hypothetical protein
MTIVPERKRASATATAFTAGSEPVSETVGPEYEYGPTWAPLAKSVEVTLSYDGLEVTDEHKLSVFRWDGVAWEDLGGTLDVRNERVVALTERLGTFTLGYGETKSSGPMPGKPMAFHLYQSYPNPAVETATIKFTLPTTGEVALEVYDLSGRKLATAYRGTKAAGANEVVFDLTADNGARLAPGVYMYRLTAGEHAATKKMVVTR